MRISRHYCAFNYLLYKENGNVLEFVYPSCSFLGSENEELVKFVYKFRINRCQKKIAKFITKTCSSQLKEWKYGFINKDKFDLHLRVTNITITKLL